ncbi:transporter [Caldichromatium japonicum]|uniref:Transporter n=1 Tax=Caldichromatium japonicum TaxID=2699430 RepID=A0A6G7VC69_9GAMM|nr:transporter [Caldichromatium japonicum]QIK37387.1 transporter [Caldichromatium japonicum]
MHPRPSLAALSLGLYAACAQAAVNEVLPGDYFPLAPGTTALALYAIDRAQSRPYRDGERLAAGRLDTQALALRLALTGWLINDKASANYLGLSAMLIAPTGDYDPLHRLNSGENRWRFVFLGGWQKDLNPRLLLELVPEIAWYGDNPDHAGGLGLRQEPSLALTGYLRWRITSAWHLHLGGQINRGGATRIGGVEQGDASDNTRALAGITCFLPEQQQLLLRLGWNLEIEDGLRTQRELILRYQENFLV